MALPKRIQSTSLNTKAILIKRKTKQLNINQTWNPGKTFQVKKVDCF